jgi:protein-tyrosine phosphatase
LIDLHSHVLPGVDDGAADLGDSIDIARAAAADGVTVLAATPHVRDDYPTSATTMERLLEETRRAIRAAGVDLELRPGGEIAVDFLSRLDDDELRRFSLGGDTRYLLLEFPYYGWPLELGDLVFRLETRGFMPVLAHPERNRDVQEKPERLRQLVEAGALVQVTAASLEGRLGRSSKQAAHTLLERELAHLVASDAHTAAVREGGLARGVAGVGDAALAQWLSQDVPAAILADERPPPRPEPRRRSWFARR